MKNRIIIALWFFFFITTVFPSFLWGESEGKNEENKTGSISAHYEKIQHNLEQSLETLSRVQEEIADEKVPIIKQLNRQEERLSNARAKYESLSGSFDSQNLDLNNLRQQNEMLGEQQTYISNLLGEYIRNFETQLHIAERQIYEKPIKDARLALENEALRDIEVFKKQLETVEASIERLQSLTGGLRFNGQATDQGGTLLEGQFVLIGPAAFFSADNGTTAGLVFEMLGSARPTVISLKNQEKGAPFEKIRSLIPFGSADAAQTPDFSDLTRNTVQSGAGVLPIDVTLGDAQKLAQTEDTFWEHIKKGGIVMIPIIALAVLSLLIAILKWVQLSRMKIPKPENLTSVLNDLGGQDVDKAEKKIARLKGPAGDMLKGAVDNITQPMELIEEEMYETIIKTRARMNKRLPFIAVCASSAPLLGLLGTVTGIINTFKLISAFGSGDARMLSSGISEALVTTEFGLIVAIPSLLLHAFLSRRSKALTDRMESIAVAVVNQITRANYKKSLETEVNGSCAEKAGEAAVAHG